MGCRAQTPASGQSVSHTCSPVTGRALSPVWGLSASVEPECPGLSLRLQQSPWQSEFRKSLQCLLSHFCKPPARAGVPHPHPRNPEASSIVLQRTQSQERTSVAASSVHMCPLQPHGPGHANLHFEPRPWFPLRKAVCVLYAGPLSATRVSVCSFVPSRVIQGHWWLVKTSKPSTAAPARRLVCYPGSPIGLLSCFSAAWWGGLGHPSTCHTLRLVLIPRLTPNLCPPTLMGTPCPPLPSWIPAVTQPPGAPKRGAQSDTQD